MTRVWRRRRRPVPQIEDSAPIVDEMRSKHLAKWGRKVRRRPLAIGFLGSLLVFGGLLPSALATSCPGPSINASRDAASTLAPVYHQGEVQEVFGRNWFRSCGPGGSCSSGGPRGPYEKLSVRIMGPITEELEALLLRGQLGFAPTRVYIGEVDAAKDGTFTLSFTVPDVPAAKYWVVADLGHPATVWIRPSG